MLRALLVFIVADTFGEWARLLLRLPVSGAVLGIVLLFAAFALRPDGVPPEVEQASRNLLRLLPLFFVPAGVGIAEHAALIRDHWPAILIATLGSSLMALLVTGFTLHVIDRKHAKAQPASFPERVL